MSLLDDLKGLGEQLVDEALPEGRQVIPILGALVAHIEAKGGELAQLELDKLAGKLKPDEPEPAYGAPPAEAGPIITEGASEPGPSKAQLEAELAQAKAQAAATAPVVAATPDEPPPAP